MPRHMKIVGRALGTAGAALATAGALFLPAPTSLFAAAALGALLTSTTRAIRVRHDSSRPPVPAATLLPTRAPKRVTIVTDRHGLGVSPDADDALDTWTAHRHQLACELEDAVAADGLRLAFAPIVSLHSFEVVAFEADLHWQRADGQVALPDELAAVAHETGLIVPIGQWLIEEACRQVARWNDAWPDRPPLSVAVDVSTRLVLTSGLAAHVEQVLDRHRVDPSCLLLEITETAFSVRTPVLAHLESVRRLGVRVAISGYGTGATSLTHLASLPIDTLKIDRGFVADLGSLTSDATVIGALVALGHALDLQIVAEGVDTDTQLAMVQMLDCDLAQGRYFAHPMSATRAADIVRDRTMHMPGI